jgi:hypothetical protein
MGFIRSRYLQELARSAPSGRGAAGRHDIRDAPGHFESLLIVSRVVTLIQDKWTAHRAGTSAAVAAACLTKAVPQWSLIAC